MTSLITLSVSLSAVIKASRIDRRWMVMMMPRLSMLCADVISYLVYLFMGLVDHLQLRNNQIHSSLLIGRILAILAYIDEDCVFGRGVTRSCLTARVSYSFLGSGEEMHGLYSPDTKHFPCDGAGREVMVQWAIA